MNEDVETETTTAVEHVDDGDQEPDGSGDEMPPVPPDIREAARLAPDHWLGLIDPAWSGKGDPPTWAVIGQWRSGPSGEVEEWRANEEYRPSPQAMGWPDPTDEVDEAVQLAATGYGPGNAVTQALATAEVAVLTGPGGGPLSATTPEGQPVMPVFTSPVHLQTAGRFGHTLMPVTEVVALMPEDQVLYLNPSGPVSMTVEIDVLREAVEAAAQGVELPAPEDSAEETPVPEHPTPPATMSGEG
ncbi:type VII secretion system-associated protein [Streptomyces sp. NPDC098781]|uniref:type VII secretion system-associated protein n=1 Tax=Streptomyces sp. NPDC098781 TaxID=3366097 RepID=UPI003812AB37